MADSGSKHQFWVLLGLRLHLWLRIRFWINPWFQPFMCLSLVPTPVLCLTMIKIKNTSPTPFMCPITVPVPSLILLTLQLEFYGCLRLKTPILSLTRPPTPSLSPTQVLTKYLIWKPAPPPCLILTSINSWCVGKPKILITWLMWSCVWWQTNTQASKQATKQG